MPVAVTRPSDLAVSVPLAGLTTLGVGGPARYYVRAASVEGVAAAASWARAEGRPLLFLGGGSNLVISDEGFPGLVVHLQIRGIQVASHASFTDWTSSANAVWMGPSAPDCFSRFSCRVHNQESVGDNLNRVL